jgi:Uma2 family endonuclease
MSAVLEFNRLELTKSEIIYGVSWDLYEFLVEKYWGENTPRLTYSSGILDVQISNSAEQETLNRNLASVVETTLLELEIDYRNLGSTTFTRKKIGRGFEPHTCFYIQSLHKIKDKSNIGIENEIPPDLIIEINLTNLTPPRMPVFAAFGVKEVWRFSDDEVRFYVLENKVYIETETSFSIPILSSNKATELLLEARKTGNLAWVKLIKNWVNEVK